MVRPPRPAQCRDLEAGDSTAILQGNTVPIRLTGRLSCDQPVREIRLYLEEPTLTRQSRPFLRILVRATRAEPEGTRRLMTCRIVLISNDRLLRNQHRGPPC